jgi:lactoylglutathione lyase
MIAEARPFRGTTDFETGVTAMSANVNQAVPFFGVTNMESSLRFYVDGLGFTMKRQWIPEGDGHYPGDGRIRWCWLELGDVAIMLQEFAPQCQPKEPLGTGASVVFTCENSLALYRDFRSRGVQVRNRPFVGNGLWVVPLADPDGYRIEFSSPTDAPEESEWEGP